MSKSCIVVAAGFAEQRPQQPSQFGGSSAFVRPPNPSQASGSAFSSVIGGREDRGLRKSFGNSTATLCILFHLV